MKKYIIIGLIALFSSVSVQATAATVAVVDMQKILQESTAAKNIRQQINSKRDAYQAQITKEEENLRNEEKKIAEKRSALSPEAFEQERKKFNDKFVKVQRNVQEKRSKLDLALKQSLSIVNKNVIDIISELSKEHGFEIAIPTQQILYAGSALDITSEVLKRLNGKLPKVKVKIEN